MRIGGFQKFTLSDFPNRVAAIVFAQGCDFRCPFCHNAALIPAQSAAGLIPESYVIDFLRARAGRLDGVVVSGGEPTIQDDLPDFLRRVRALGLEVKLDTNGSRPRTLERLIGAGLVDFIAMDVKAPPDAYARLAGVPVEFDSIAESIAVVAASGIEHEFRTTAVGPLLSAADLRRIAGLLPPGSRHKLQPFRSPGIRSGERAGEPSWKKAISSASGASFTSTTMPPGS